MSDLSEFAFREFEAGPRRDTAQAFHDLATSLEWLREGEKKDIFLERLLEARNAALDIAQGMLR